MKKISFVLLLFLFSFQMKADEGMWLLPLLEKMNINTMQAMGCKLSAEDIYSVNHSSIKDAIVHFGGGCTGEMISKDGLVITNHHCGYSSIQQLSSVEHDYLTDGYWAMNRSQELPAAGLTVTFLESMTDVTAEIESATRKAKNDEEWDELYSKEVKRLVEKATGKSQYLTASVSSLFGGNVYYLIVNKTYKDVRFVGAPPSSIGKFGADTDNWMWPRHTCDFSMFRVYADKDNNPAEYSEDNVPYHPVKSLEISIKGYQPGDFTMIIGYPGTTNRFMTASELKERVMLNDITIKCRTIRQDLLMEDMLADPKVKIQYASKYTSSSNAWKKYIGMNETFVKLDVEARRAAEEVAFKEWVNQDPKRQAEYGNALNLIDGAVNSRKEYLTKRTYISETLSRIEILSVARSVSNAIKGGKALSNYSSVESFYKDYNLPTDIKVAKAMLTLYKESVDPTFVDDVDEFVDNLYSTSVFTSIDNVIEALATGKDLTNDPAVVLASRVTALSSEASSKVNSVVDDFEKGKKSYIAGTMEMHPERAFYPDANSTMRLSYATVEPYSPKDAVIYNYYTTLDGVMEKEDPDNWEFVVPEKLKELHKKGDYGRYAMENGKLPACFLTTGDITGGNSGSPVLNDRGQLLGLAFDGNWEAMSGDIIFEPELQRCINVDIRYVLYIMDYYGGAGYLMDEMTIVE